MNTFRCDRYTVMLGRTYADGTQKDYEAVNALQAQYKITPQSAWGKPIAYKVPPVDPKPGFSMTDKPQKAILDLGAAGYFDLMARLMGGTAPPAKEDSPVLARMSKIGIVPGKPFDGSKLEPAIQAALKGVPNAALLEKIGANKASLGRVVDGWVVTKGWGCTGRTT